MRPLSILSTSPFLLNGFIVHPSSLPSRQYRANRAEYLHDTYISLPSLNSLLFLGEWEKGSLDDTALRATDDDIAVQVRNWFLQDGAKEFLQF